MASPVKRIHCVVADAAAAKAAKQLQSEVPQKLEWLQGKLEEAERRNADNKRTQQASADAAQARIHDLEAQVCIHSACHDPGSPTRCMHQVMAAMVTVQRGAGTST